MMPNSQFTMYHFLGKLYIVCSILFYEFINAEHWTLNTGANQLLDYSSDESHPVVCKLPSILAFNFIVQLWSETLLSMQMPADSNIPHSRILSETDHGGGERFY